LPPRAAASLIRDRHLLRGKPLQRFQIELLRMLYLPPSDTTQFWFAAVVGGIVRSSACAADPKTSKAMKTKAAKTRSSAAKLSLLSDSFIVVSNSGTRDDSAFTLA
jgi:hypothetical protein